MKNVLKTMMVVGVFALFAFAPVNVTEATTLDEVVEVASVEKNLTSLSTQLFSDCLYILCIGDGEGGYDCIGWIAPCPPVMQ